MHPAERKYLWNGDELKQFERLRPDDAKFDELIDGLMRDIRHYKKGNERAAQAAPQRPVPYHLRMPHQSCRARH
ncbi:hypothetical protein [Amycolatopsis sp. NPDC001319]|uniref:hypothetical protein n=1 Tax=unclassified Amycolatopsis TaxID=2618356 RepID=UPI0036B3F70B